MSERETIPARRASRPAGALVDPRQIVNTGGLSSS